MRLFREKHGGAALPAAFVTAHELSPQQHLLMQAALQRHVDASISKTVNCPEAMAFEDFETLYLDAYRLGLKGCTAYRPNPVTGEVLSAAPPPPASPLQPALPLPLAAAGPPRGSPPRAMRSCQASPTSSNGRARTTPFTSRSTTPSMAASAGPSRSSSTRKTWSITPGRSRSPA